MTADPDILTPHQHALDATRSVVTGIGGLDRDETRLLLTLGRRPHV